MSDTDICSDDKKNGGFGATMANSVAADSAAPARAVAAVAVAHTPGTKKSLPVTVAERIWKTKGRSKRQKKSNVPAHVLQAAVPAPVPLVAVVPRHMVRHAARYDGALAQVTRVFSSDPEVCDTAERRVFFKNKGYCRAVIISTLPESTM